MSGLILWPASVGGYQVKAIIPVSLIMIIFFISSGCGGGAFYSREGSVTIVGRVISSGPDPFSRRVMVLDTTGTIWVIQDGDIESELFNLSGLVVAVTGLTSSTGDNRLSLKAESYRLLRPGRFTPIVGILKVKGEFPMLEDRANGTHYVLLGRIAGLLREFAGRKVWVCGNLKKALHEHMLDAEVDTILVEEFGVVW